MATKATVYVYRKSGTKWIVARKSTTGLGAGRITYSVGTRVRYKGSYRVRTVHECADHVYGSSASRYLTVR